jgi:CubicO group peptidase (beta-lactamase class C family)
MKRLLILLVGLCLFFPVSARAETVDEKALDAVVAAVLKDFEAPGIAVAVVKDDKVVYLKGAGVREAGTDKAVTPDTLFAIGSCSKAFTATAVAMLVDEGKMGWDDPVRKHLPTFHLADPLADRDATIRDLLCHRTGLNRHDILWVGSPWGREELIRRVAFLPPNRSFRARYEYNNLMFLVAGEAAGKAAGSSWEDLVRKRIFEPLEMKGADFSVTDAQKAPDHARPHHRNDKGKVEAIAWRSLDNIAPAGAINAGVRDLANWLRFQLADGVFEGRHVLSAANLQETHKPQITVRTEGPLAALVKEGLINQVNYALGWMVYDYRGQLVVAHTGAIEGFRAQTTLLPRAKLGIVVLTNVDRTGVPPATSLALVDLLLDLPHKDWNAFYLDQEKKQREAADKAAQQRKAERHPGTKPSRELKAYAGVYEEPAYGQAEVTQDKEKLTLRWSNFKMPLEHFHFDTFTATGARELPPDSRVTFRLNADGDVEEMTFLGQKFKKAAKPARP